MQPCEGRGDLPRQCAQVLFWQGEVPQPFVKQIWGHIKISQSVSLSLTQSDIFYSELIRLHSLLFHHLVLFFKSFQSLSSLWQGNWKATRNITLWKVDKISVKSISIYQTRAHNSWYLASEAIAQRLSIRNAIAIYLVLVSTEPPTSRPSGACCSPTGAVEATPTTSNPRSPAYQPVGVLQGPSYMPYSSMVKITHHLFVLADVRCICNPTLPCCRVIIL